MRMAITQQQASCSFARRFLGLAGGYWHGDRKGWTWLLSGALVGLTIAQVTVPVLVNLWSQRLFDALEQHSIDRFLILAALVGGIIALNIVIQTLHVQVKRRLQYGWREWLTKKLLNDWLSRGRHHQVTMLPGEHDNPDGRIAEDIRNTVEFAVDLGHSLLYCVVLLVSFTNILWMLSDAPRVSIAGMSFTVPGYLLYIALAYAAAGTTIALLLGRPLVRAVNGRQGFEADFRCELVRVRENAQAISLLHGESEERRRVLDLLRGVCTGWYRQTRALAAVTVFSSGYSVLSMAFPILVAAPRYIGGFISLGVLMQTAQAFQQTVAALSWPVDNLGQVASWKASVERVLGLYDALQHLDREVSGEGNQRIVVRRSQTSRSLSVHDLSIDEPDGRSAIEPFDVEIQPGERVVILGDQPAAVRFFRAVARIWPWGSGQVVLPEHTHVYFMPHRPYLPRGPLRAALSYPARPETVDTESAQAALQRVGLHHLLFRLDETEAWEELLTAAEKQRLGFARLLINRPDWIFMEAATDALDPAGQQEMHRLLDEEFAVATLLTIGNYAGTGVSYERKLVFERTNGIVRMREERRATGLWGLGGRLQTQALSGISAEGWRLPAKRSR